MGDDFAYTWNDAVDKLNDEAGNQLEYAEKYGEYLQSTPFSQLYLAASESSKHTVYIPRTTSELVTAYREAWPGDGSDSTSSTTTLWLNNVAAKDNSIDKTMRYTLSLLTKLNPKNSEFNVLDAVSSYVNFVNSNPEVRTFGGVPYSSYAPTSRSGLFDWIMGLVTRDVQILPPEIFHKAPRFSTAVFFGDSVLGKRALATKRLAVFEGRAVHGPVSSQIFYTGSSIGDGNLCYFNLAPVDTQDFNCLSMGMSNIRLLAFKGTGTFTFGDFPPCNATMIFLPRISKLAISNLEKWTWAENHASPWYVFREIDLSGLDFTNEKQAQVVRELLRRVSFEKLGGATSLGEDRKTILYAKKNTAAELLSSPCYPFGLARGCEIISSTGLIEVSGKTV